MAGDTMPVVENAKHERMAQGLAKGLSADKAYVQAGYKPHRGNAARLSANERIKARVAEIQQKQVSRTIEHAAINAREEMQMLRSLVRDAREAGDIKTAMQGQMFILECFGFKDLPTLTHEMLGDRSANTAAAPPTSERQAEVVKKNVLQFGRVHQELERLAGPRVIEHDPTRK
ncbi:hypothetical protein [Mesorhizobium sp. YM1C-6-2]|uniref:hypothetical protein n=1 Tax=Mesorhizobium sp. YM1C-6-2 TaxID=1827501 RepID=UPI0011C3DDAF|nr:hypothetical protein [Mesorhizobium sp. YM1C-6-2]